MAKVRRSYHILQITSGAGDAIDLNDSNRPVKSAKLANLPVGKQYTCLVTLQYPMKVLDVTCEHIERSPEELASLRQQIERELGITPVTIIKVKL